MSKDASRLAQEQMKNPKIITWHPSNPDDEVAYSFSGKHDAPAFKTAEEAMRHRRNERAWNNPKYRDSPIPPDLLPENMSRENTPTFKMFKSGLKEKGFIKKGGKRHTMKKRKSKRHNKSRKTRKTKKSHKRRITKKK